MAEGAGDGGEAVHDPELEGLHLGPPLRPEQVEAQQQRRDDPQPGGERPDVGVDRFAEVAAGLGDAIPARAAAFLVLGAANWTYYWYDPDGDLSIDDLARGAAAIFSGAPVKQL